jgi:peptidoglycan hydrolase-like protein with peptidoglycan-binding domain
VSTTIPPVEQSDPAATKPAPPAVAEPVTVRRRRRRWGRTVLAVVAAAAVAGAAAAAALGVFGGGGAETPAASNLPPATAEVAVGTLVATEELDGTLGYGTTSTVLAAGSGIVTWRPGVGETIERGGTVYSVNAEPVVLIYGKLPFFRSLTVGNTGPDVEQLEENLAELGYGDFTVDNEYTDATADVVAAWQEDVGLAETGVFDPATATVADGPIRVAELLVPLGGAASGEVLSYTGTDRQITVTLEVADQQLVAEDLAVTVTLPDGASVDGTISEVGTVVSGGASEEQGGGLAQGESEEPATFEITITVDDTDALGDWETTPVDVLLETGRRADVLTVPVGALVALAEGGYGVQVVEGTATRYVVVEAGLFADGLVEISGPEVTEGMVVGVPAA